MIREKGSKGGISSSRSSTADDVEAGPVVVVVEVADAVAGGVAVEGVGCC